MKPLNNQFEDNETLKLEFTAGEVWAMLDQDEDTLNEFADLLRKYKTWIRDCKRIRTKELLSR